ncbi:MAG: TatD family hydrolase [Candidatus Manganitrophus sp.]|nr:TatD family hydrolase [Candidatus Manganitrophus sp.]WDT72339.1 MAG: TatD family hydrolase [Candidatus Manganitrophus sp.]
MMEYIDMHAHMASRTTDDYEQMALTGCVALTDPAFWAGFDRSSADGFDDYFHQLTEVEPKRAARVGIRHYTWLCLNPKEADNRSLARAVIEKIPKYLDRPNVLGIGEIGLNRVTRNEVATFQDHLDLAVAHNQMILIHTPHLEDKYKGTRIIVETLLKDGRIDPGRILIDHAEEHTIGMILENGFWAGITLYPQTKVSPQRAIDMIERAGPERICVSSACDWGPSLPIAIPRFALEMRRRRHSERSIRKIIYENPAAFLSQSPRFMLENAVDRNGQKATPSAPSGAR